MKKRLFLSVACLLFLAGCAQNTGPSSSSETSSMETSSSSEASSSISSSESSSSSEESTASSSLSSSSEAKAIVFFESLKSGYSLDMTASANGSASGQHLEYLEGEERIYFAQSSLTIEEGTKHYYGSASYFADKVGEKAGLIYQEAINVKNQIAKSYVTDAEGNYYNVADVVSNLFLGLTSADFKYNEDGTIRFKNLDRGSSFLAKVFGADVDPLLVDFLVDEAGELLSFGFEEGGTTYKVEVMGKAEDIVLPTLTPFKLNTLPKGPFKKAIANLGSNYTVDHRRSNANVTTYFLGDSILVDKDNDGLGGRDEYYTVQENGKMKRDVYGADWLYGPDYWAEGHYADMYYSDNLAYGELALRLSEIDPGFFASAGNGIYTSIPNAAPILSAYCQPLLDGRALYNENATSIEIHLENDALAKIVLHYTKGGSQEYKDTLYIKDIGATSMPSQYLSSIDPTAPMNPLAIGTFAGTANDKSFSLEVHSDRSAVYTLDGTAHSIDLVNYAEYEDRFILSFDYGRRSVTVGIHLDGSGDGNDSNKDDFNEFYNLAFAKSAE